MEKLEAVKKDLESANVRLIEVLEETPSEMIRDAAIQRFEFTFELSWKYMQIYANQNGIQVYGPKNAIREAASLGLIDNPEQWITYLNDRNLTTHTYKEALAEEIFERIPRFVPMVKGLLLKEI